MCDLPTNQPTVLIGLLLVGLGGQQCRTALLRQFGFFLLEACGDAAATRTYIRTERVIVGGTGLPDGLGGRGRSSLRPGCAGAATEIGNDSYGNDEPTISPIAASKSGSQ